MDIYCVKLSDMGPVIEVFFEKPPYLVVICDNLNVTYCIRTLYSDLLLFYDFTWIYKSDEYRESPFWV